MEQYDPEVYWSRVAREIEKRGESYVAGDDNPYFRYKRQRFLKKFLDTIDLQSKVVLEVGFGPGGNLKHLAQGSKPRQILGADVSQKMVDIAAANLREYPAIDLRKIDGVSLPFPDRSVDVSFTATVLHHNTDEGMFRSLVRELCRVTKASIVIMEDIGMSALAGGQGDWIGRRVEVYESAFAVHGFQLSHVQFLNTRISRAWYHRVFKFYRRFVAPGHREGDRIGGAFKFLIALPIPLTRVLDNVFTDRQDLAKLVFRRIETTSGTARAATASSAGP
jgi:SAM-dependent methyltransferase